MANDSQQNLSREGTALDDAILAATRRACRQLTTWHGGLCPDRDDLTGIVLLKLCSPAIKSILEKIWTGDGFTDLSKFIRTVSKHTLVDEVRRLAAETRNPEGGLVSLDEPIRNEDGETCTRADLISDADGTFQAFQFDDLREQLTPEEFTVLHGIVADRATEQELAEEIGTSDSTISRTYTRAKGKAANWIRWLGACTEKQARAHICPTFMRRPCLRPNGIAPETLERWNDAPKSACIVPFHDEAREWHPPITKQPHVRAKRECWNAACQNGLAIGADNLVLPSARGDEAVRFLPAYTGQDNRMCAGCEASKAAYFFGETALNGISDATEKGKRMQTELMNHKQAAEIIKEFNIPRSIVARLSGLHLPDLSAWLNGKQDISDDKRERVSQWVADVAKMIQAMATLSIKVDLSDVENVRLLVQKINDAEMQMDLALDVQEPPLRMTEPTSGTADWNSV